MNRTDAISWVLTVCAGLRLSQAKTLSHLVAATLSVGRVSLPEIGRRLGLSTKQGTKRVWRFTKNHRVEISDAMQGVVAQFGKRHQKKPLVVALDWVEIRNFHVLMLAAVMKGRAAPLLWASYEEWQLYKSQNNLEEGLLRLLRTMLPPETKVIILADRGFGRTEMARLCQQLRFHYVIRIKSDVWINTHSYRGKLLDFPVKKGIRRVLRGVQYRRHRPVEQNIVIFWKRGLPKRRDECWFLMTDLKGSAHQLTKLYGSRMTIEEFFRDGKSRRNGFALRNTRIQHADRLNRLLLILVLAYLLLIGLGLHAQRGYHPSCWCTNTRASECSVFTIGRRMLEQIRVGPFQAIREILDAVAIASPNWG